MLMEIPRHWRRKERLKFSTPVLINGNGWRAVEGFGNSIWVFTDAGESIQLSSSIDAQPTYPSRRVGESSTPLIPISISIPVPVREV